MKTLVFLSLLLLIMQTLQAQSEMDYAQQEVIYGRKDGMALTMFVIRPQGKPNGRGIINVNSGGWFSGAEWVPLFIDQSAPYLERGYTVFIVNHGSQPRYTVPEVIPDIHRAVRYVRFHAGQYQIDPEHLGITGGSAGGHLSLMVALADDKVDANAKDPIDRVSSRVQAVACFFPPTDLLNFGQPGANVLLNQKFLIQENVRAAVHFTEWDSTAKYFVPITDIMQRNQIARQVSPIYQVSADDPPVFVAHGDRDELVPLQQSEILIEELKAANVPCHLLIKEGAGHGWEGLTEVEAFADWFDKYLQTDLAKTANKKPK
jgi:acetyl esterase/lipase